MYTALIISNSLVIYFTVTLTWRKKNHIFSQYGNRQFGKLGLYRESTQKTHRIRLFSTSSYRDWRHISYYPSRLVWIWIVDWESIYPHQHLYHATWNSGNTYILNQWVSHMGLRSLKLITFPLFQKFIPFFEPSCSGLKTSLTFFQVYTNLLPKWTSIYCTSVITVY